MQIVCPSCRAEAEIPSSKEGARVRCGACGRVYTAEPGRPAGRRPGPRSALSLGVFGGGAALALIAFFALRRHEPAASSAPPESAIEPTAAPATAPTAASTAPEPRGWSSPPVLAARELFAAAALGDAARLEALRASDATDLEAERDGERLADWRPFDGEVLEEGAGAAAVRLSAGGSSPATASETRLFDVRLVLDGGQWKVSSWERWLAPEERERAAELERAAAALDAGAERQPVAEVRTLADGSLSFELEPRPVPFPEDTSVELRARITATYARLVDSSLLPMDNIHALDDLVAIGAPALPALLTGLYELPLETDDDAVRVNMVNECLEAITGTSMGFNPQDPRPSSIRRWFAWWQNEGATFRGRPAAEDPWLDPEPASEDPPRR